MRGAEHDKLWNQLEAEIHLHRHKTVIRACRGRNNWKKKMPVPAGHVGYTRFYKPLRCCFELVVGCIDYPLMLSEVVFGA